ncbi:peptidase S8/S53 domain-containing protein [Nemania sp. NC0429]|nr:peptidase S8/S53 domain-containing protein [Nemania sp. NC0429]
MERRPNPAVSTLLPFALAAVGELRRTVQAVAKALGEPGEPEPFLTTLGPLLSDVETRLNELGQAGCSTGSDAEKRVLRLLAILETLVRWPGVLKPPPRLPFKRDNYPFLDRLVNGIQQTAKTNIKRLAKSTHDRAPVEREKFRTSFRAFASTERSPRGPPLSDLIMAGNTPAGYDNYTACLRLLHTTLCRCSPKADRCGGSFMANLALTRVQRLEDIKDEVSFDFFFLHRHPDSVDDMWKEAQIRVFLQGDESRPSRVKWLSARRISPDEFCGLIRRRARGRLVLNAASNGLVYERAELSPEQLERLFILKSSSVSLATVLEKRKLQGDVQIKLLLSYLLAKAVWQFYDSDWMASNWSKDRIHFMRERISGSSEPQEVITLIHKPYFATELSPPSVFPSRVSQSGCSIEQDFMQRFSVDTHLHPKILALGIMLLEIELGEGIEVHQLKEPLDDENPMENEDHYTAGRIIVSEMWKKRNVYQAVKEMIEICLKPDTEKFGIEEVPARDNLYTYVVAPLGRLFRQAWSHNQDPESFSAKPVSFKATEFPPDPERVIDDLNPVETPVLEPTTRASSAPFVLQTNTNPTRSQLEAKTEASSLEEGELLDDKGENTLEEQRRNTDKWFSNFQTLLVRHRLLGRGQEERIKVAILDSGIDIQHPDFSGEDRDRIKEKVTFISSDAEVDTAGHGTHVAAIILRLTKNVDLYIGKITNNPSAIQREHVAEALKFARTEWRVHMITLSFGFDSVRSPDTMGDEIRQYLHDGIMVFASASNDGGEGSRTYPAKYSGVICAHSATWRGSKAERNPGLEEGHNFSFVGEHVRPIWPAKNSRDESRMKYKSGTSYAAPVAVSVAAFMIGYIRKKMPDHPWVIKPWSPEGISTIFRMMAVKIDGYDWVSPTRYLKYTKEGKILGDLEQYIG